MLNRRRTIRGAAAVFAASVVFPGLAAAAAPVPVSPADGASYTFDGKAFITFVVDSGGGYTHVETSQSPERGPSGSFVHPLSIDSTSGDGSPTRRALTLPQGAYWRAPGVYYWQPIDQYDCAASVEGCWIGGAVRSFSIIQSAPALAPQPEVGQSPWPGIEDTEEMPDLVVEALNEWEGGVVGGRNGGEIEGAIKSLAVTSGATCRTNGSVRVFAPTRKASRLHLVRPAAKQVVRSRSGAPLATLHHVARVRSAGGLPGLALYFHATKAACQSTAGVQVAKDLRFVLAYRLPGRVARTPSASSSGPSVTTGQSPPACVIGAYRLRLLPGVTCSTAKAVFASLMSVGAPAGWTCYETRCFGRRGQSFYWERAA